MPCSYLCSGIYFGLSALEPYLTLLGLLKFSSEPRFEPEPGELNSGFWFGSGSVLPLSCRFWFWFGAPALNAELVLNWFEPEPDRV